VTHFTRRYNAGAWGGSRETDRRRVNDEGVRRLRGEAPPDARPTGYWTFFAVVAAIVVLAFVFLVFFA
jgi:hypothetical protein